MDRNMLKDILNGLCVDGVEDTYTIDEEKSLTVVFAQNGVSFPVDRITSVKLSPSVVFVDGAKNTRAGFAISSVLGVRITSNDRSSGFTHAP